MAAYRLIGIIVQPPLPRLPINPYHSRYIAVIRYKQRERLNILPKIIVQHC